MKIAVLGGGHGAYASAAELSDKGHEVWFWRRDQAAFADMLATREIVLRDFRGQRRVRVAHPVAALQRAVAAAELIVVPTPALAHEDLAREIAPFLRRGQVVFLPPGTLGSLVFARALKASGNAAEVAFCETGTLPYLVRKHGPAAIVVSAYATRLPTGVFPARDAERAIGVLRQAYPAVEGVEDALSGALMNAGPVIHPPLILMNAGPLEHFDAWDIHNEGTQPSVRAVTNALDAERIAIRAAIGYQPPHFPLADHYASDGDEWMYGRAAHGRLTDSGDWREKIELTTHRYMREDTALGLPLIASAGRWAGCETPVASGLLAMAGAVVNQTLYDGGRTLEAFGLDRLSRAQMTEFLRHGY